MLPNEGAALKLVEIAKEVLATVQPDPKRRIIDPEGRQYTFDEWSATLESQESWAKFGARVKSILSVGKEIHLFCQANQESFGLLPVYIKPSNSEAPP